MHAPTKNLRLRKWIAKRRRPPRKRRNGGRLYPAWQSVPMQAFHKINEIETALYLERRNHQAHRCDERQCPSEAAQAGTVGDVEPGVNDTRDDEPDGPEI